MMRLLYYHKDADRGALNTYNWLVEEVKELGEALRLGDKVALEGEFADVMAWLASLANVVQIDLEKETVKKYNWRCPKCQRSPCVCAPKGSDHID